MGWPGGGKTGYARVMLDKDGSLGDYLGRDYKQIIQYHSTLHQIFIFIPKRIAEHEEAQC